MYHKIRVFSEMLVPGIRETIYLVWDGLNTMLVLIFHLYGWIVEDFTLIANLF